MSDKDFLTIARELEEKATDGPWAHDRSPTEDAGSQRQSQGADVKDKEVAIVEIYEDGTVCFCGTWKTIDVATQNIDEARRFVTLSESIGFCAATSAFRCNDVRILPVDKAQKLYEESKAKEQV